MKFLSLCCFVALMGATLVHAEQVRLDSYKVYNIMVGNEQQLKDFNKLGEGLQAHYMKQPGMVGRTFDVAVAPNDQAKFEERLRNLKYAYETIVQNLQKVLDEIIGRIDTSTKPVLNWTAYHDLSTIYNWLDTLVFRNPFTVRPYVIGYSYEGRPIRAIRFSRRPGNKAIFIDSNIHGIEWITSAAGTCFFEKLINSRDPVLRELSWNYDWIFVPIVNPDGFYYTKHVSPLWRKNRRPNGAFNESGLCYGVDLNRNFDYHFKDAGYNMDVPCDHWYAGAVPESEPEVVALERFIKHLGNDYVRIYLALHSYGNMVLLPYGHTFTEFPPNYAQMANITQAFVDAAQVKYGTKFVYGPSGKVLYVTSGTAKDWAYGVAGIPYSATVELRDRGQYGFFLPPSQIIPVCEEFTDGVVAMVKAAAKEGLFQRF